MRLIVCIAAVLMFLSSFSVGQDDLFTPMKGSATPEFQTLDGKVRCLVFGKHVVKLISGEDVKAHLRARSEARLTERS